MTYRLDTIGGSDTFMTNASPYGYFGRAEYLIVGGTSTAQYWGMMKWDMTTLPTIGQGDKVELMLYGLNFSGQSPTDMQLGMSATPWADTDGWKVFSWYGSVLKIVPATPYDNWMAVDITNWYSYWKNGQIVNNGILFLPASNTGKYTAPASVDISVIAARPYLRVTTKASVPVPTPSAKFLDFPLSVILYPQGAYTPGKIISVMDHNMTALYQKDGGITTFTGEQFAATTAYPTSAWAPCYPKVGGGAWSVTLQGVYRGDNSFNRGTNRVMNCLAGVALNYDSHPGYDYMASAGTNVYAAAAGKVVSANGGCVPKGFSEGCAAWGAVGIDTDNGYIYQYLHLGTIKVVPGQVVQAGALIGLSGNTTPPTTGVGQHLHFEVLKVRSGFTNDYKITSYANVDPYGFNTSTGVQDVLGNLTGTQSICLWKSGCTNP